MEYLVSRNKAAAGDCKTKIRSFTDLVAWKEAHSLVKTIYRLTENFPASELFALTNQLRRAVVSISSNVAEGFSRAYRKEKRQFYATSMGSLTEVQNLILIAKNVGYICDEDFRHIAEQSTLVSKLINGLLRSASSVP